MSARVVAPSPDGLAEAAAALRDGQVVGMPTETVYGLAGLASDDRAVPRIFAVKGRPTFDPLIVHVWHAAPSPEALGELGVVDTAAMDAQSSSRAARLMRELWPGPLTLVLPRGPGVVDLVSSGLSTVAVRMPAHPVARALVEAVGPLAAPSANRFGRISPTSAPDVLAELGDRISLILDGGRCAVGVESTVVSLVGNPQLLRPGGVPQRRVEELLGVALERPSYDSQLAGPGMLPSHYAPRAPLILVDRLAELGAGLAGVAVPTRVGILAFDGGAARGAHHQLREAGASTVELRVLSTAADGEEAARSLFRCLRELDAGVQLIVAERCPIPGGLGPAIQDRLNRAAAPRSAPSTP